MISRTTACILFVIVVGATHEIEGNEFNFVYNNLSPDTIELDVIYDGFQIEAIRYGGYTEYMHVNLGATSIFIRSLSPCTLYRVDAKVKNLKTENIFYHAENILTIPPDIVLQTLVDLESIVFEVNYEHANCFINDGLLVVVDNTRHILYTRANFSTWLTISGLSQCVNYNFAIYIIQKSKQFEIYNKIIRTISLKYRYVETISYDETTMMLRWPNFLGDCTLKYFITFKPENELLSIGPIEQVSTFNEYKLDFLAGCTNYAVTVASRDTPESSHQISIVTGFSTPSSITNLKFNVTGSKLLITWEPPIANPGCVDAYDISFGNFSFRTKKLEHTILDYKLCKVYNFSICINFNLSCQNCLFDSSDLDVMEIQNVSAIYVVPDKPFRVQWNSSNHDYYCIKFYNIIIFDELQRVKHNEIVKAPFVNAAGLQFCQKYRIQIKTIPIQNLTSIPESNFNITIEPEKPSSPLPPELISKTSSSITLKSKYVNQHDKCEIELYRFSCHDSGDIVRVVNDEYGQTTISNLKSYNKYDCTASVKNKKGWSASSEIKTFFVEYHYQSVELYVNSISSTSVDISWSTRVSATWILTITKFEPENKHPYCQFTNYNNSIELTDNIIKKHDFRNLEPNTNYLLRVDGLASNINYGDQISVTTDPDVPFQVINLNITRLSSESVTFTWQLPCTLNGRIKNFMGETTEIDLTNLTTLVYDWIVPYSNDMLNHEIFNYTEDRIKPGHHYKISVATKLANFVGRPNRTNIEFKSPDSPPKLDQFTYWAKIENLQLKLDEIVLTQYNFNGFQLLISEQECANLERCSWLCQFTRIPGTLNITISDNSASPCGRTDSDRIELKTGIDYELQGKFLKSSGDFSKTTLIPFSSKLQVLPNSGKIMLIISLCLILVAIPVAFWLWYKFTKNRSQPPESTYFEVEYFYKLLSQKSFEQEFQSIIDIDLSDLDKSAAQSQPGKNRYTDITPYDFNRVVLGPNEFCTSDYINASYVDGYKRARQYIATQGPKEETVYDFWHMVVEQKSEKIVMLTQLQEGRITNCYKYFPLENEILKFNDLEIASVDEIRFDNFIRRDLVISKGSVKRFIIHLQFIMWSDRDCPAHELDFIEFIEFTRSLENKSSNPLVVHCSCGIGRTGTFIALDILFLCLGKDKYISICDTVRKLHRQRYRMVQTEDQYQFLYDSINLYYLKRIYKGEL